MTNTVTPQDAAGEGDAEGVPLTPDATPGSDVPPDGPTVSPMVSEPDVVERSGNTPPLGPVYRPSYVFLLAVSLLTLAADLGTKWWAKDRLEPQKGLAFRKIEVLKDHVNLVFAKNHGGAWGILGDESEAIRRPFFLLISLAAIVFIVSLFRKLHPSQTALRWGLPLVLGGALGNLVDRVRYGFVVDFIQIRVTANFVWPTFNVADIAIVVGVGLMAIDMFVPRRTQRVVRREPEVELPAGER